MAEKLTSPELSALKHHAEFGQMGEPTERRVTASEWKTKQFKKPITSSWNVAIPPEELPKLLDGFCPQAMEDKWFVYADGPDAQGRAILHMFRSWTGYKVVQIAIEVPVEDGGVIAGGRPRITGITWESSEDVVAGNDEQTAKEYALGVCNWVLGVKLPSGDEK
jgi:hypothetical protein